jgi:hypothetical protein
LIVRRQSISQESMPALDCGMFGLTSFNPVVALETRTDVAGGAEGPS